MNKLLPVTVSFLLFSFLSCREKEQKRSTTGDSIPGNDYRSDNDSMKIKLTFEKIDSLHMKFKLFVHNTQGEGMVDGKAELIREEDNGAYYVPEPSPIADHKTNQEYLCDSGYEYHAEKVSISWLAEKDSRKRISLTIYHSTIPYLMDDDYTLYRTNQK